MLVHLTKSYEETANINFELNVIFWSIFFLIEMAFKKKHTSVIFYLQLLNKEQNKEQNVLFVPNLDALLIQNLLTFIEQRHCSLPQINIYTVYKQLYLQII